MRRNIFIRILCLLLCLSMLPLPAAAAQTPLYTYPTVEFELTTGETTNEMAYVDQFYKGAGEVTPTGKRKYYLNDYGLKLLKWLDMSIREDGSDRTNSGYLMLEQEMEHQASSRGYKLKEYGTRFLAPVTEYIASGNAWIVTTLLEEASFMEKFGWAGKSAYPYYTLLCEFYVEYVNELQAELNKADESFEETAELIQDVAEVSPDTLCFRTKTDAWIFTGKGKGPALYYKVVGVDPDTKEIVVEYSNTRGRNQRRKTTLAELKRGPSTNNRSITVDFSEVDDDIRKTLNNAYEAEIKVTKRGAETLYGLEVDHLVGYYDGLKSTGYSKKRYDAIEDIDSLKKTTVDISNELKEIGNVADKAAKVASVMQAAQNEIRMTAQQASYLTILANVSQDYLNMLNQWHRDVSNSDVPHKKDIVAAIGALTEDILNLQAAAAEDLDREIRKNAANNMSVFASGEYAEVLVDLAEEVAEIAGFSDIFSNTFDGKVSAISSMMSMALNYASADFLEFDEKCAAIYNLKWSLYELLTDEYNGLLVQYAENRNHETACKIIHALNTMKAAKILGENLWEEYYLCDFYDSMKLSPGAGVHLVLRNELAQRNGTEELDASESFTPVIGVYKDYVTEDQNLFKENTLNIMIYPVILGYYLPDNSYRASYKGVTLESLPEEYSGIMNASLSTNCYLREMRSGVDTGKPGFDSFRMELNCQDYETFEELYYYLDFDYEWMYKDEELLLYSSNGVDVIVTEKEYEKYLELEKRVNELQATYGGANEIDWYEWEQEDHGWFEEKRVEEEQQFQRRLEWTSITRRWIESIKMYDPDVSYI